MPLISSVSDRIFKVLSDTCKEYDFDAEKFDEGVRITRYGKVVYNGTSPYTFIDGWIKGREDYLDSIDKD